MSDNVLDFAVDRVGFETDRVGSETDRVRKRRSSRGRVLKSRRWLAVAAGITAAVVTIGGLIRDDATIADANGSDPEQTQTLEASLFSDGFESSDMGKWTVGGSQ